MCQEVIIAQQAAVSSWPHGPAIATANGIQTRLILHERPMISLSHINNFS